MWGQKLVLAVPVVEELGQEAPRLLEDPQTHALIVDLALFLDPEKVGDLRAAGDPLYDEDKANGAL